METIIDYFLIRLIGAFFTFGNVDQKNETMVVLFKPLNDKKKQPPMVFFYFSTPKTFYDLTAPGGD